MRPDWCYSYIAFFAHQSAAAATNANTAAHTQYMRVQCVVLLASQQCTYSVGFAVSTGPHGQQHGIADASTLLLRTRLPLLLAQQVLPPCPELMFTDAARLPHKLFKQGIQVPAGIRHACCPCLQWHRKALARILFRRPFTPAHKCPSVL